MRALSAEFYGTPFAHPFRLLISLVRGIIRELGLTCGKLESMGLGRIESALRMKNMPARALESTTYNTTTHKTSGRPQACNKFLSKVYLWGEDDAIVQERRAVLPAPYTAGNRRWKPYCHDSRKMEFPFSGDAQEINSAMCEASFLSDITNNVCKDPS